MKRCLISLVVLIVISFPAYASHIFGGEMIYEYISAGTAANTKKYRITLKLFRDDNGGGAALPSDVYIGVFDFGTRTHYPSTQSYYDVTKTSGPTNVNINISPCATGNTSGSYSVATYSFTIDLPDNPAGYICAYETCCRINGIANVNSPVGVGGTGVTYACKIPGTNQLAASEYNSSPQFRTNLDLVCRNIPFTWDFSATDPDADSLDYSFFSGFDKTTAASAANVSPAAPAAFPPYYPSLAYINGFTPTQPLGTSVTIDNKTGIISGIAPNIGLYVTAVLIKEYRNGVQISQHWKDFILRVQDCQIPKATLNPQATFCKGFDVSLQNATSSPLINTYFWDFGVPGQTNDTSNLATPTFTYPDTGVYIVKLVTNRYQQCTDSATVTVRLFPGFFPGFTVAAGCYINPVRFTDTTLSIFGSVNTWRWDFGDNSTLADSSHLQNPQWTYPTGGQKTVRLIVSSNKGCIDTAQHVIDVFDKPVINLAFKDTLICRTDNVQLNASGTGVFSWTPVVNITGANTATPTVNPITTTTYFVRLDDNGCVNNDSVRVRVIPLVTLNAMNDTTICQGDVIQLTAITDGLTFAWTPAANLSNPTILNPLATTSTTTTYRLTATVGSCSSTDDVIVTTVPYPIVNAGTDPTICYNTSVQLNASMNGTSFVWSPINYLNDPTILNPIATPARTTQYILSAYDTKGCPKPGRDTITVTVNPKILAYAGRDTTVVIGQPLQFNGSGGIHYLWSPNTGLSSTTIFNPIGKYGINDDSIRYKLIVTDNIGCADSAYVMVKVFKTNPYIFVPTAFTPNNDGLNDFFAPIAVGIQKINYFSVYNRWGQLVFTTTVNGKGWDGRINGKLQNTGVYVWMVSGLDYLGGSFFEKGTVTLIR